MASRTVTFLPSIAIGNFTWDWIYADYPRVRLAPSLLTQDKWGNWVISKKFNAPMLAEAQRLTGPCETRLDGAHRAVESSADRLEGQVGPEMQDDHLALIVR